MDEINIFDVIEDNDIKEETKVEIKEEKPTKKKKESEYVVKEKDCLMSISKAFYGTWNKVEEIKSYNGIDKLTVGMKIKLPQL